MGLCDFDAGFGTDEYNDNIDLFKSGLEELILFCSAPTEDGDEVTGAKKSRPNKESAGFVLV